MKTHTMPLHCNRLQTYYGDHNRLLALLLNATFYKLHLIETCDFNTHMFYTNFHF